MNILRKTFSRLFPTPLQKQIFNEFQRALAATNSRLPDSISLPDHYGHGLPERVVEILLARLSFQPGMKVLDIGYAFAMECHLEMIRTLPQPRHLAGIDIAKPQYDTRPFYEEVASADIIDPPFDDSSFDLIWCISTLEHFGMDNSGYTEKFNVDKEMDFKALVRIVRLLRKGGMALVTVPFGKPEDHGWFRNFDITRWSTLLSHARDGTHITELFFRYTDHDGWRRATSDELKDAGYFDHANGGAAGLAVACLVKA